MLCLTVNKSYLSRGCREGDYGKKGMQWFGMAAFVKNTIDAHICQEDTLGLMRWKMQKVTW